LRFAPFALVNIFSSEILLQMHATAAMAALRQGPVDLVENLERHAELIDMPRIGTDDNFAFPNMQLNISPASPASAGVFEYLYWACELTY
jgi:hypothetical protein